ncbi:MAG: pantoate--beta-alanine ligase, partial [Chthoniobacterales bacterium]
LLSTQELVRQGETSAAALVHFARTKIHEAPAARIDYVEIVDADDLRPVKNVDTNALLALAVFFGKTRLIDNIRLP